VRAVEIALKACVRLAGLNLLIRRANAGVVPAFLHQGDGRQRL
jgi:hypothetical protein